MGDWNAVIGEGEDGKEIGKYGLEEHAGRVLPKIQAGG